MAFVEFRDVRKTYRMGDVEVHAVDGMDFEIERGEFCVIVGPSGAGKTTVLNMLGGMDSATSGTIMLDGREISGLSEHELTLYRRHEIAVGCTGGQHRSVAIANVTASYLSELGYRVSISHRDLPKAARG